MSQHPMPPPAPGTRRPLGRRQFLAGLGGVAGGIAVAGAWGATAAARPPWAPRFRPRAALAEDKGEVNIITWETYHDDEWLEAYREAVGVSVNATRAGSVDEMFAKVRSGGGFDLAYFDLGSVERYRDAGLLIAFDDSLVANQVNIADGLPWQDALTYDGELLGLPYCWGTLPLMWNADEFPTAPTSWSVLWDEAYKGRVTIPDDSYIGLPMIALAQGIADPYNLTDEDFDTVQQALSDLRPQLKTLTLGFDDAKNLYAAGEVVVGYCQNIAVPIGLNDDGLNFGFGYPEEGTPFWIDSSMLLEGGNRQEVYDFVDHTLSVPWQATFIETSGNAGVLSYEAASAELDAEVLARTEVQNQADPDFWDAMSPLAPPNDFDRRLQIWNEFKAGL
jgi:spermidine/putrescine transport system substrate-binding protein